jgi:hypothetical protein
LDQTNHAYSFVDESLLKNKGYRFGTGRETNKTKSEEFPSPNSYDPCSTQNKLGNPCLMTLAPCKRITDEEVSIAMRRGVPGFGLFILGPGAYELKDSLEQKLTEPRNRIRLGGGKKI